MRHKHCHTPSSWDASNWSVKSGLTARKKKFARAAAQNDRRSHAHLQPLLIRGERVVSSPHGGSWRHGSGCALQCSTSWRTIPTSVPHSPFPGMEGNAGVVPQVSLEKGVHCSNSLWSAHDIQIIEECEEPLTSSQTR